MVNLQNFILCSWKWNGGHMYIYSSLYVDIFKAENNFHGHLGTIMVDNTKCQNDKPDIFLHYEVINCVIGTQEK